MSLLNSRGDEWWRDAVIYQIYPRSFADGNGDGVGDLQGIIARVPYLKDLGVDAVWLSPFYPSPGADGGYDVADYLGVDPLFGTLADFDEMLAAFHAVGIKVIIDIVPNHCSVAHELFQQALRAPAGSAERSLFHFRDGRGADGAQPPNNWQSHFGGPAWTRLKETDGSDGQWYLHLFDSGQPDFNWDNPAVPQLFEDTLRFWVDRGVDGFRVDVAHLMIKDPALPDWGGPANGSQHPDYPTQESPMFGRPGVHQVFHRWREILDDKGRELNKDLVMCGEVCVQPLSWQSTWAEPGKMHTLFNFALLEAPLRAREWADTINDSLRAFCAVGAPTIWVLSNHDVVRHATRYGYAGGVLPRPGDGVGPTDPQPNVTLGKRRAAAATMLLLALPGSMYLYQGEELGLGDNTAIPDQVRQDPTWHRTGGQRVGRDGCRVPIPWDSKGPAYGFNTTGATWLPQPPEYAGMAVSAQEQDDFAHLALYRRLIALRRQLALGKVAPTVSVEAIGDLIVYATDTVAVLVNFGAGQCQIPETYHGGEVLALSAVGAYCDGVLAGDAAVWLRR